MNVNLQRIAPIVMLAAVTMTGCNQETSAPVGPATTKAATAAPAPVSFTLPDLEGKEQASAQWHGRVVVLNFWAPWCPPCRKEIPDLIALQQKYAAKGVTVVGITVDTVDNAQNFVDTLDINYPILIGEDKGIALAQSLGNTVGVLPYTVVLDRQGRVAYTHRSEITLEQAERVIAPLL